MAYTVRTGDSLLNWSLITLRANARRGGIATVRGFLVDKGGQGIPTVGDGSINWAETTLPIAVPSTYNFRVVLIDANFTAIKDPQRAIKYGDYFLLQCATRQEYFVAATNAGSNAPGCIVGVAGNLLYARRQVPASSATFRWGVFKFSYCEGNNNDGTVRYNHTVQMVTLDGHVTCFGNEVCSFSTTNCGTDDPTLRQTIRVPNGEEMWTSNVTSCPAGEQLIHGSCLARDTVDNISPRLPKPPNSGGKSKKKIGWGVGIAVAIVLIIVIGVIIWWVRRKKNMMLIAPNPAPLPME